MKKHEKERGSARGNSSNQKGRAGDRGRGLTNRQNFDESKGKEE